MNNFQSLTRPKFASLAALVSVFFGLLTIKSGGAVLFEDGAARVAAGHYVPFVLWFNFLAGFVYILAGVGLFLWRSWAVKLSMLIAITTLFIFAVFIFTILNGGYFESRTVGAMILRSTYWLAIALYFKRVWLKQTVSAE